MDLARLSSETAEEIAMPIGYSSISGLARLRDCERHRRDSWGFGSGSRDRTGGSADDLRDG